MFFEFDQIAKITSINPRAELHGEDPQPACDIMFEASLPNSVLNRFSLGLLDAIYKSEEVPDLVDQATGDNSLKVLRFPDMSPFKWNFQGTGYTAEIDYGLGGDDSNIKMGDITVDKFRIEPQNGGSVVIHWRAIAHPNEADIGKLYGLMQHEVDLILTPPEPKNLQEAFGDQSDAGAEKKELEYQED